MQGTTAWIGWLRGRLCWPGLAWTGGRERGVLRGFPGAVGLDCASLLAKDGGVERLHHLQDTNERAEGQQGLE